MPDSTRQPIIGIAGGIGSGKSALADALRQLGCVVAESDAQGRAALRDPGILRELTTWWGDGILDADGAVDRRAVAAIVFNDPEQRRRLESLTHPWIEARRLEQFASADADVPALVIDAPLLYEAGLDRTCDAVIFVEVPRSIRLQRVMESRGWDDAELQRREDSQLPLDVKRSRADYVIQNDGDRNQLFERCRQILNEIISVHQAAS